MKKAILLFLFVALALTLGCSPDRTVSKDTSEDIGAPAGTSSREGAVEAAAEDDASGSTADAVSKIESELDDIEDIDTDFLSAELEDLDAELDFEI